MAITNYTELQTAVTNWLNRTDLAARIPEFIALAEADIARQVRQPLSVFSSNLTAGDDSWAAPTGEFKSLRLDTDTYKHALTFVTPATLAGLRRVDASGVPFYATFIGQAVYLDVAPDDAYAIEYTYRPALLKLTGGFTNNTTLTNHPDIYLYGALKESEPYLEHDERNPMWAQKYQKAVDDANLALERAELGQGPVVPRLPIIFG